MLEGVFDVGKEACCVEELRRLDVRKATVERRFGQLCNGVEKRAEDILANHGCSLEQVLLLKWEPGRSALPALPGRSLAPEESQGRLPGDRPPALQPRH